MTAENSATSSEGEIPVPYSRTWFKGIISRATELIIAEDPRLAGIEFLIVQADPENGVILKVWGDPEARGFLPKAPAVFKKFIREAALLHGPDVVREALVSDPYWPLLAYHGHLDTMDDPEGGEVVELRSSSPPATSAVETRVDTSGGTTVDHPAYYNTGTIEVWDATDEWGLGKGFNRGSAIKYIARAGDKPDSDELDDLKKARQFLDHEIERMIRDRSK